MGVGRGEQYLRQKKAEKLLKQRREGDEHSHGDGGRAHSGRSVWCMVSGVGAAEMAAVYQASRFGVQMCIGRSRWA
jgi:hypothetical protein